MIRKKTGFVFSAGALFLGVVSTACELDNSCDPNQELHPEFELCVDVPEEAPDVPLGGAGGETGDGDIDPADPQGSDCKVTDKGPPDLSLQNIGDACDDLIEECDGYTGTDCIGGTICGGERFPQCVALCGPGDAFEGACPDGYSCTDLGEAQLCWK